MGLNINKVRQSGFTIVELLIVVVVIAILAAITIVSYNGITTQANSSAAKATASTFQKKAELYYAEHSRYPVSFSELSTGTGIAEKPYYLTGNGFVYGTAAPTSTNGKNTVQILKCASGSPANQAAITDANISGLRVNYYNYDGASNETPYVVIGTGTCPNS